MFGFGQSYASALQQQRCSEVRRQIYMDMLQRQQDYRFAQAYRNAESAGFKPIAGHIDSSGAVVVTYEGKTNIPDVR